MGKPYNKYVPVIILVFLAYYYAISIDMPKIEQDNLNNVIFHLLTVLKLSKSSSKHVTLNLSIKWQCYYQQLPENEKRTTIGIYWTYINNSHILLINDSTYFN